MEIILLFGIFLLSCIMYIMSGRDILSPSFVSCCMFGFAVMIAIFNLARWGIVMEPLTVLLVLCSLFCMGVGEVIGRKIPSILNTYTIIKTQFYLIHISKWSVFLYLSISSMICFYSYIDVVQKAQSVGFRGNGFLLNYARAAMQNPEIAKNKILALAQFAIIGIGYVFVFSWINNFFFFDQKSCMKKYRYYLLPLIPWIIIATLSTGRGEFIRILQMAFFLFCLGWSIKYQGKKISFIKAAIIGLGLIGGFFIVFQLLGLLTGKTYITSAWNMFSIYAGSSLVALNESLKNVIVGEKGFGAYSLMGLRDLLVKFGFQISQAERHFPFVIFDDFSSTNVYSGFMPYYLDFGFIGTVSIYLLMGCFFGFFYYIVKRRQRYDFITLTYAYFAFALITQIYSADFLRSYFSVTHSFVLFFMLVGYWVFVGKNKRIFVMELLNKN